MKTGLNIELVLILRLYKEQTCQNGLKICGLNFEVVLLKIE